VVEVTEFDTRPPTVAVLPALAAAAVAVLAIAVGPTVALMLAGPGAGAVAFGAQRGVRRFVTLGAGLLFVGAIVAGATGLPLSLSMLAGIGAIVAYDTGEHAINLGVDVGNRAAVTQSVLGHAAASVFVGSIVGGIGYAIYSFGPTSLPVTGLIALLAAAVFLTYAIGE
jgi:hypothetical protein